MSNVVVAHGGQQLVDLVAGVDHDTLARPLASHNEAVLVERSDGTDFEDHWSDTSRS